MSKLYKIFYFDPCFSRYLPILGIWSSVSSYLDFMELRFGSLFRDLYLNRLSFIKIPFFGYLDSDFHGYSSLELRSLAPRVHRSETRRPRF